MKCLGEMAIGTGILLLLSGVCGARELGHAI